MALIVKFISVFILIFLILQFGSAALERHLLYHPDNKRITPLAMGLNNVIEKEISSPDGTKILTWWASAQPNKYTILYFHGNAGSLSGRSERIQAFNAQGFGIVMMTYRGYSGTHGTPSERINVSDARMVYESLKEDGVPADRIVIYGESLGTGVALHIASEKQVAGLILDAPYTSMVDLAELHYPLLPSRWLMKDRYESLKLTSKITVPLLVLHGEADTIVPVEMGRAIAASVKGPTLIETFAGAGHSDHYQFGSFDKIINWLNQLSKIKSDSNFQINK